MSEDMPMRCRKADLRSMDHDFYNPDSTYSFGFTEEIYRANTFIPNGNSSIKISIDSTLEDGSFEIVPISSIKGGLNG